jgi:hypothetical protein
VGLPTARVLCERWYTGQRIATPARAFVCVSGYPAEVAKLADALA